MNRMARTTVGGPNGAREPEVIGIDGSQEARPGVPMEAEPRIAAGVHWRRPERQWVRKKHFKRRGLDQLTPVFGNAVPPRGVSGVMRRVAYMIPENRARHWGLLLLADRVDVLEGRLGRLLARPLRTSPISRLAGPVEKNPARVIGLAYVALIGTGFLLRQLRD